MKRPLVHVAVAVCHKNGCWLVAKRHPHAHLGGKWEFPGGKSEADETAEQTALRELHEECGVQAVAERTLAALRYDYGDRIVDLTPVVCCWRSGEPRALASAEVKWVQPQQMARLDMPAINGSIIREVIAMSNQCR